MPVDREDHLMISRLIRIFLKGKVLSMVLRWFRGRSSTGNTG